MNMNSLVPKIIAIFFGILVAVSLAIFGFNAVKNVVGGVTNGAENAISSVTGQSFDIDGNGSAGGNNTGNNSWNDLQNLGQNVQGGLNFQ